MNATGRKPLRDVALQHLFSYSAHAGAAPDVIGPVAEGIRAIFPIGGGEIDGPALRGRILPGGGDWLSLRSDGVAVIDVRLVFESHDGALIYCSYGGIADFGADGHTRFLRGELPPQALVHAAPRFQTAHPAYQALNRVQAVSVGEIDFTRMTVTYDVYALR